MRHYTFHKLFIFSILCSLSLFASAAETETDYLAILLQGQKVGHAIHERVVDGNIVVTSEEFTMTLGRGGQAVKVFSKETHRETIKGEPLAFEMTLVASGAEQKTSGTIKNGKCTITKQVMGQPQTIVVDWPKDALMFEGMRLFQTKRGLTPGDEYEVTTFRPDLMMSVVAKTIVGDKKKIDLFGRVVELTEVKMITSVQDQNITMTSYVDDDTKAQKTLVPMMGMTMEMVACDKNFAMRDDDIVDFLEKLSITSPVELTDVNISDTVTYTIKPTNGETLSFPNSPSQKVEAKDNEFIISVTKPTAAKGVKFPYQGDKPEILEAMKPSEYLQSDNEVVIDLAKSAVGGTEDAATAATQIEAFVSGFIIQKDLSVGYASAAEVAKSRQGDCSEHAVLTAAMCRAVGIPARVVCGVVYADSFINQKSIFGGHMWAEAYIGNQWVGLDATRAKQGGFGPGHIALAFGNGEPADFFSLINTLGCFTIEKIVVRPKSIEQPKSVD